MKLKSIVLSAALVGAFALQVPSTPVAAQDEAADRLVIGEVSCRDLLLQLGAEQERTISFLHGYAAGAAGRMEVDVEALALATSRFLEACIEDPDASALSILQDILG